MLIFTEIHTAGGDDKDEKGVAVGNRWIKASSNERDAADKINRLCSLLLSQDNPEQFESLSVHDGT